MATTRIEWAESVWNPVTGCTPVSPGCQNCYAARMAKRLAGRYGYPKENPFKPATWHYDKITPAVLSDGKRYFVGSMGDVFHETVNIRGPEIREMFRCMATVDSVFMLLTKRPQRMAECIKFLYGNDFAEQMPNVWAGVTAENQEQADKKIPILLQIPASVRFVSAEPMLEPMNLQRAFGTEGHRQTYIEQLDWVICGGETGPGARPIHPDWVRSLRDQCVSSGTPFFFKRWGTHTENLFNVYLKNRKAGFTKEAIRILDGIIWNHSPNEGLGGGVQI